MSEEAKVGLAYEAIAVVSSGQKDEVRRRVRFSKKYGNLTAITSMFTVNLR